MTFVNFLTIRFRACGCAVSRLTVEIVIETADTTGCEAPESVVVVAVGVEPKAVGVEAREIDTGS